MFTRKLSGTSREYFCTTFPSYTKPHDPVPYHCITIAMIQESTLAHPYYPRPQFTEGSLVVNNSVSFGYWIMIGTHCCGIMWANSTLKKYLLVLLIHFFFLQTACNQPSFIFLDMQNVGWLESHICSSS